MFNSKQHPSNSYVLIFVLCRSHAIACVNQFIISRTQALMLHIDTFIQVTKVQQCFFFADYLLLFCIVDGYRCLLHLKNKKKEAPNLFPTSYMLNSPPPKLKLKRVQKNRVPNLCISKLMLICYYHALLFN